MFCVSLDQSQNYKPGSHGVVYMIDLICVLYRFVPIIKLQAGFTRCNLHDWCKLGVLSLLVTITELQAGFTRCYLRDWSELGVLGLLVTSQIHFTLEGASTEVARERLESRVLSTVRDQVR